MGKRLERFGKVRIIDETNGFEVDLGYLLYPACEDSLGSKRAAYSRKYGILIFRSYLKAFVALDSWI